MGTPLRAVIQCSAILAAPSSAAFRTPCQSDSEAVAEFIRTKGITRCPTACVLPTQGLVAAADRVALEEHAIARDRLRRAQAAARWRPFLNVKAPHVTSPV